MSEKETTEASRPSEPSASDAARNIAQHVRSVEQHKTILPVVAAALVDTDGRVLLAQRPEGKSLAGLWEFPGGKMDAGETPEQALIRELDEELGIELCPTCFAPLTFVSHAYEKFHLLMMLYIAHRWEGIPQSKEGQALTWKRPRDMRAMPMPPADLPLIPALEDALRSRNPSAKT